MHNPRNASQALKTMNRLERALKARHLWDGSAIHYPRRGDMLVHVRAIRGERSTVVIGPFGGMRRMSSEG